MLVSMSSSPGKECKDVTQLQGSCLRPDTEKGNNKYISLAVSRYLVENLVQDSRTRVRF